MVKWLAIARAFRVKLVLNRIEAPTAAARHCGAPCVGAAVSGRGVAAPWKLARELEVSRT